ncbi:GNAT family N-acetyltransferase [Sulfobacillus harzensis]|uniref:Acetyltransferase n=1 Tax=Sulfobacillus harzensis TaxID=2729629 RepID=A0A7Y0L0I0_9FIRM|nr:GNAT family N-acetyltransferase [Sulfobacillus harzensis]NMP21027.1 acetyltransferase [Sulfobacillus harzensis]
MDEKAPFPIESDGLSFRPMTMADVDDTSAWLTTPEVLAYYEGRDRPQSPDLVRQRYLPKQGEPVQALIVWWKGRRIGYVQVYPLDDKAAAQYQEPADDTWGMDLFIGEPALWGQGLGTRLVNAITDSLFHHMGARRILIDPRVNNPRALHVYQKCGFRILKRLPSHEFHEGIWQDCVLMEKAAISAAPSRNG